MKRAIVIVGILVLAAALAGGVWWYAKDHVRISRADIQHTVASKAGGQSADCLQRDSNAAHWLCAVIGPGTARCLRAHVRPWGAVELHQGYRKCAENTSLAHYFSTHG